MTRCPTTVVVGQLGSGKTTLINHALRSSPNRRIAVLVNDFGDINIDQDLVFETRGDVVSLTNGCICCAMQNDAVRAVRRIIADAAPDQLMVEASGVSNGAALAPLFADLERQGLLRLDGVVAVVDCETFPYDALAKEALARDQLVVADLAVLNKIDLVSPEHRAALEAVLQKRFPELRRIAAHRSAVPTELLFGLDVDATARRFTQDPPAPHPDFFSRAWVATAPISLRDLQETLAQLPSTVVRVKGILWCKEHAHHKLALHRVGRRSSVERIGTWEGEGNSRLVVIGTQEVEFDLPGWEPAKKR